MFGNLEGAVRRGRGGKEKLRTDCVQSDIRAFGITGDWEMMAVKAEVWVEAVTREGKKKNYRGQTSAFPSETSRFAPLNPAHRGSALYWLY